jgi:hypothetical protein
VVKKRPAHFPQRHALPDEPGLRPLVPGSLLPVPGLIAGLPVQLEHEGRMATDRHEGRLQILMAGDARIGPAIEVSKVAHPRRHAIGVGPVRTGVAANPLSRQIMAADARYAL